VSKRQKQGRGAIALHWLLALPSADCWENTHPSDEIPAPKPESVDSSGVTDNVSRPTTTVYAAKGRHIGVAVVVFPGEGYRVLATGGEGTEICNWLTSRGLTRVLLKYRVAGSGPWWGNENNRRVYPKVVLRRDRAWTRRATPLSTDWGRRVREIAFRSGGAG
jgi:hypothetical protein